MKNKFVNIGVIIATVVLAGIAIFTAIRLYQLRSQPVAPNVPSSEPAAAGAACTLTFTITLPTATPTKSPSPTPTPTKSPSPTPTKSPSPSPTANPQCNTACTSNSQCPSQYICYIPTGSTSGNCRNAQCLTKTDCQCPTASPSPTPTKTATPTATATSTSTASATPTTTPTATSTLIAQGPTASPEASLPDAGTSWPTIIGTVFGILVIMGSLILIF